MKTGVITTWRKNSGQKGGWEEMQSFKPTKILQNGTTIHYLKKRYIHKNWFAENCDSWTIIEEEKSFFPEEVFCPF
jgi:hypothetical protein